MRVLITGAAGFIGMHLALTLREMGHEVLGIDNMMPYYSLDLKEMRASKLAEMGIPLLRKDIVESKVLIDAIESFEPTHFVHLAALAGVRYALKDPFAYLHCNIDGFLAVLEAGRQFPSLPIIWASSSSVYGANTKLPFSESDRTDSPTTLYGATKKSNEAMAYSYHHLFGLKLIGLRFFTVYGPYGRPDMAYYLFAKKLLKGEEITLFGHGMKRDFTYIDDIVHGIILAMTSTKSYALYNLGGAHPEPVEKLIQLLEKNLHKKALVRVVEHQKSEMMVTCADVQLIEKELGFVPKISLEEGISQFCEWVKSGKMV